MKLIDILPVALLVACACSKKEGDAQAADKPTDRSRSAGGCPPARILIDGVEKKGLNGLSVTLKNGEYETEQVELYDSAVDCAAILAPSLTLPEGTTVALRAYYHQQAQGLGTDSYTAMGISGIQLAAKAKAKGGDTEICIPAGATFTPDGGTLQGKKVEISGNLAGRYCGVKDMNAR